LDLETEKVMYEEHIQAVAERFHQARSIAQSGEWQPNRDKDELTYALSMVDGREAMAPCHGSMPSLRTEKLIEVVRERRKRTGNGYASWRRLL
jgi:hypothetical protein